MNTNIIIQKAKEHGIACHKNTNHLYDGKPYETHLQMVYEEAIKYSHLVEIHYRDNFLAATWVHDTIEGCREEYYNLVKVLNHPIADLVFAVSNEKGRGRDEKQNPTFYSGIKKIRYATLLKVCDRIANIKYSIATNNKRKTDMYFKENQLFISQLKNNDNEEYHVAFNDLELLCLDKFNVNFLDEFKSFLIPQIEQFIENEKQQSMAIYPYKTKDDIYTWFEL
jgi:(p)ppGpp synthase/HD superfamily hydrolase